MKRVVVRYAVKPDRAAENVALVCAVYDELHGAQAAEGFDCDVPLADGVSFVHLVETEDEHDRESTRSMETDIRTARPSLSFASLGRIDLSREGRLRAGAAASCPRRSR